MKTLSVPRRSVQKTRGGRADVLACEAWNQRVLSHKGPAHSKRHNISRNLLRIGVDKFQAGALDEGVGSANLLGTYDARIGALERLVSKQTLELEFLKEALRLRPRPRSKTTSAIVGPAASALLKGGG